MKEDSLLSILVPISRRSDKNSGGANQKRLLSQRLISRQPKNCMPNI